MSFRHAHRKDACPIRKAEQGNGLELERATRNGNSAEGASEQGARQGECDEMRRVGESLANADAFYQRSEIESTLLGVIYY
jgi:hypothetical protein